jgi:inner membrane protein involved in colicin E2 resistance
LLLLLMPLLLLLQMLQLRRDFAASSQSNVTWQVLGNTVVMGPLNTPDVESATQQQGFLAQTLLSVSVELFVLWLGGIWLPSRSSRASWPRRCCQ